MTSNTIYKSPAVSCLTCRKELSAKGIFSHLLYTHGTEEEKLKMSSGAKLGLENGRKTFIINQLAQTKHKENLYEEKPALCKLCLVPLPYDKRKQLFCNHHCSATYHNNQRDHITYKRKNRSTLGSTKGKKFPRVCYVSFCKICGVCIHNSKNKTCCPEHLSQWMSLKIKERGQTGFQRREPSYLERSFEMWLNENCTVPHIKEKTIHNKITNKWYFVDFFFESIGLIVELDGKQHLEIDRTNSDLVRDEYITTEFGYKILRISHKEYKNKTKLKELCDLLNIR